MKKQMSMLAIFSLLLGAGANGAGAADPPIQSPKPQPPEVQQPQPPIQQRQVEVQQNQEWRKDPKLRHFAQRLEQVHKLGNLSPEARELAMKYTSTETGVPLEQVRALHEKYPGVGAAGVLLANVFAAETKLPPEQFLKERQEKRISWVAMARQHHVPIDKLNVRLDHLQTALAPLQQAEGPKDPKLRHFTQRMEQVRKLGGQSPQTFELALKHISTETGVPVEQVRALHQKYPKVGPEALLLAHVFAAETKLPPEQFLNERQEKKISWVAIAKEHKVPIDNLNVRLDHLEKALAPTAQTGK